MNKKIYTYIIATVVILISLGGILKSWVPVIPVIVAGVIFAYIYFGWNYGGYKLVNFIKLKVVPLLNKRNVLLVSGIAVIILLLLSFNKCTGCTNNKPNNNVNSPGQLQETTEEEKSSIEKDTTEEETTSVEDTSEEETTTPEETTKKTSPGKTSPVKGSPVNKAPEVESIPETTTLTKEEKESLGIVETPGSVNRVEETTMKTPEVETSKQEIETTSKVEVTEPSSSEIDRETVTAKPPKFEEDTTTEEETTAPEEEITVPMLPVETMPVANADVTISYTSGASKANALVTFDGGRKEGIWFSVKWKGVPTDAFKAVKNPDGSYSIKVDVPKGCNSKLIITVFDKNGNELGENSKIIKNN